MTKVSVLDIRGRTYDVMVDTHGVFCVTVHGKGVTSKTMDDLYRKVMEATRKDSIKINVPITDLDRARNGIVTGIHAQNRNYLVLWEDRKSPEQERGMSGDWVPQLSKKDMKTLEKLIAAKRKADQALNDFTVGFYRHKSDMRKLIQDAYDAAANRAVADEKNNAMLDEITK